MLMDYVVVTRDVLSPLSGQFTEG